MFLEIRFKKLLLLTGIGILVVLFSRNIGIFWDNVLFASAMGNPLYENGMCNWGSIPVDMDPGHPPFLASLMAGAWTLFGKSLSVSHWAMLPFIIGTLWQLHTFVRHFIQNKSLLLWAYLLVCLDPTLLSQMTLVSPEIILMFFFFTGLNACLRGNLSLMGIALAFLGIVSLRGMMLCAGIFLIDLCLHGLQRSTWRRLFSVQRILAYLIGAAPAISYLVWRLWTKGYISSHPDEKWGNAWHYESIADFIQNLFRNIIVLGHQVSDFGRIVPIVIVLTLLYSKRKSLPWDKIRPLLIIATLSTSVVYITSLLINNTMGHRYYLPNYITLGLIVFILIQESVFRKQLYGLIVFSLLMGNLIVYPDTFAQGWDSSLAHLPYWKVRKEAIEYMDSHQIPISKTASFFPNKCSIDYIDLNGDERSFIDFTGTEPFVFYSNVYNISDKDYQRLSESYNLIHSSSCNRVRVDIFQKRK